MLAIRRTNRNAVAAQFGVSYRLALWRMNT